MNGVGSAGRPLRVAVVGAGPAGFYTLGHLFRCPDLHLEVDLFERLPAPFGLVRYGVAPDHPKDKSVARVFERIAGDARLRFFGNVEYGRDLVLDDLQAHYHQVVFATGAQQERALDVPGESLTGSHSAAAFVAWYNGHPDYAQCRFDLGVRDVAVVGAGNVALDVARLLCRTPAELEQTDIAAHALEALRQSRVRNVYLLARRGPAQAAFTPREIRELGELPGAQVSALREDLLLDPAVPGDADSDAARNVACVQGYANAAPRGDGRRVTLRFFVSPTALLGSAGKVTGVRLARNAPRVNPDGSVQVTSTDAQETLPAGLVFRAVGYRGEPLAGVPFDRQRGTIENQRGRVTDAGKVLAGLYTAGWIKRGPSGVIGTNKTCARDTVECMLEDLSLARHLQPASPDPRAMDDLIAARVAGVVRYSDWRAIDAAEVRAGEAVGRPRVKFTDVAAMLAVLGRDPGGRAS